jgi:multisubunit Na+/H+ antiporter MnhG subunit
MIHSMVVFLGALGGMLFVLMFQEAPSARKCVIFSAFGAILGYSLYPVGSKIRHKIGKSE